MGVIFLSGIYGVGKSTLCKEISKTLGYNYYDASDLININTSNVYGKNKNVTNVDINQRALIENVNKILSIECKIIISGHFTILNKLGGISIIPDSYYNEMYIDKIVLIETFVNRVQNNLKSRDSYHYDLSLLEIMQKKEKKQAKIVSKLLNVPLLIHKMLYNNEDIDIILKFIETKGEE